MRSRYNERGSLAGIRVALDATNFYDFYFPTDSQNASLADLLAPSFLAPGTVVQGSGDASCKSHSAVKSRSGVGMVRAAALSENGVYPGVGATVSGLFGTDAASVRNSSTTGFGFAFEDDGLTRNRCGAGAGRLALNAEVASTSDGLAVPLGRAGVNDSAGSTFWTTPAELKAKLAVFHDLQSGCCRQALSSPAAVLSGGAAGSANTGVLESRQVVSAGNASTTPFQIDPQHFRIYRLTYGTTTTSTTPYQVPQHCLAATPTLASTIMALGTSASGSSNSSSTTTLMDVEHPVQPGRKTMTFYHYEYEVDATLQVDESGRLFYQISRSNVPEDYWARSGWTDSVLEPGRWYQIAMVHKRDAGHPFENNRASILVDGLEVRSFPLYNIYDLRTTSLNFCGYRVSQLKVWSQATPPGDLGVCSNRHKTIAPTQAADYRYRNLKLDVALDDRYYYEEDLLNSDKFSIKIDGRWRADGPSRCRYDRAMMTYCLCFHGDLSKELFQHTNENVDRERFPAVRVVEDITRKYYFRSREALQSPGQTDDHVLPDMSVRISHAEPQSTEQELAVHRPYSAVDTTPVLTLRGAGRNELDWGFYVQNSTTGTETVTGYEAGEDGALTLDLNVYDFQRWDLSYFTHRVELGLTCDHCLLRSLAQTAGLRIEQVANGTTYDDLASKLALTANSPNLLEGKLRRKFFYIAGPLKYLNEFLSRLEYKPDRNFFGTDGVLIQAKDNTGKVSNLLDILITVQPVPDIPALICPPAFELDEGNFETNPGFDQLFIADNDVPEGTPDDDVEYTLQLAVSEGTVQYNATVYPHVANDSYSLNTQTGVFKTVNRLADIRKMLSGLTYEATSTTFHGVVLATFNTQGTAANSLAMECSAGILVHPVNTPPSVTYSGPVVLSRAAMLGLGISVAGLRFDDVDFGSERYADRTAGVRVMLSVGGADATPCVPTMSLADDNFDRILGIPTENIGGTEGMTFLMGNGWADQRLVMESSLAFMNRQIGTRLLVDPAACQSAVELNVTINDLGNYGKGSALEDTISLSLGVVP
ncbi:unnamed protein product [Amoebophrya sp. A25]|nr:unnamed protein product [Amoebophrya sp. A25]|eukprot:GSA25T00015160001.1